MDLLHDEYRRITGASDAPIVMEVPHDNGHARALDEFIDTHFGGLHLAQVLADRDNPVQAFVDIARTTEGLDCRVLVVQRDGENGVSRYFEATNDPALIAALGTIAPGSHSDLRFVGKDVVQVLRSLGGYFPAERIKEVTGKHPYGVAYEDGTYLCMESIVRDPLGLHLRVAHAIVKAAMPYKALNPEIIARSRIALAYSMMRVLTLAAPKGTDLTIRGPKDNPQTSEALSRIYTATQQIC